MAKYRFDGDGVDWFLPRAKRRFATTTPATSDLIGLVAEQGRTVAGSIELIHFDDTAVAVLRHMASHGLADTPLHALVRTHPLATVTP